MSTMHVIGNLTWDRLIEVPTFPQPNQDYLTLTDSAHAGGAGANVAAGLALLGIPSSIVAAVGLDTRGDALVAEIATYGVDTSSVQRVERATSEFLCVIASNGDRSFLLNSAEAAFALDSEKAPYCAADRYAFVGCRLELAAQILERSSVPRSCACANIGFWAASRELTVNTMPLLDRLDCVFLNSDEFAALPERVRAFLTSPSFLDEQRRLVITGGATEAVVLTAADSVALAPNRALQIANTLGCGDAFMAGYLAAHFSGLDIQRCLALAHECAGRIAASPLERHCAQFAGIEVA